ncbi:hypothetical protein [Paenibacillus sp. FSL W7-1332]
MRRKSIARLMVMVIIKATEVVKTMLVLLKSVDAQKLSVDL